MLSTDPGKDEDPWPESGMGGLPWNAAKKEREDPLDA
jgi:hypothetical protein